MPAQPCPGACNRAYRRAHRLHEAHLTAWHEKLAALTPGDPAPERPGEPDVRPWWGDPWCTRCRGNIHQELAALDDLACIVMRFADGHRGALHSDQIVNGNANGAGPGSPSPALDAVEEMLSDLRHWETTVRAADPLTRRGDLAQEVTTVVSWLTAHYAQVITHPLVAVEFGEGVEAWFRRLTARGRTGAGRELKPMPCPGCRHMSLYQESGARYVECGRKTECSRVLTLDEYDELEDAWRGAREKAAKLARH